MPLEPMMTGYSPDSTRYVEPVSRPTSEANALVLPVTDGWSSPEQTRGL